MAILRRCAIFCAAIICTSVWAVAEERWKDAVATVFWIGEAATSDNGFIANVASAWDERWMQHFGGVDDPHARCGYAPCAFKPRENPFYIALPYNDKPGSSRSNLKNRWVAVRVRDRVCYAQWQDVGPFETRDWAYVFGNAPQPLNQRGVRAGIDLSPAVRDCLRVGAVSHVKWRHVEPRQVPTGPWKQIISKR